MGDRRVRTEQDPFDPAEHRGVRADAKRQAQDCQNRKPRSAAQLAKSVAQILNQIFQDISASSVAALLFDLGKPADRAHG